MVGRLTSSAVASEVCSSSAARFASQTSVGRSSATQYSIEPTGAIGTHSGRCGGHCFSKNESASTPSG